MIVVLLITYRGVVAQTTTIKGQVFDKTSKLPIPFASIGVKNTNKGTLTNQDGFFEIEINSLPFVLTFSHLSYENKEISVVEDSPLSVQLELATILLPEARVSLLGSKIMKNVYEKYSSDNYEFNSTGYYKQVSTGDKVVSEFFESFNNLLISPQENIKKYKITNARYGQIKKDSNSLTFSIINFKYVVFGFPVCKQKFKQNSLLIPLIPDAEKYYSFVVEERIQNSGNEILKINCLSTGKSEVYFEGYYYIDRNTKSILKIDGTIKGQLGLSFKNNQFQNENDDTDILMEFNQIGSQSILRYIHASTSSKFTSLKTNKSKQFETSGTLYITDNFIAKTSQLGKKTSIKTDDFEEVKKSPYDPEFWKRNNPIKYTIDEGKTIDIFNKNSYFGTYFEKD